jgi:thioredoxin 1
MLAPVVEELASENSGSVKIAKVNVDECQQTAQTYGISSIPTLLLFKDGEVQERIVGLKPKARLQELLDAVKG